ncbi:unnamed protein product [Sphagnum jensenii]|uniref:Uncharacterized protein n=1 Tax=Sphagnum jensenii TaxID=128206 RepID=A0ABP1B343_9BRYO
MGVPLFNIKHSTDFSTVIAVALIGRTIHPVQCDAVERRLAHYKVPPYACKVSSYVAASFLCWVMPCCQDIGGTCPARRDHVRRQLTHHRAPPYAHKAICTGLPHSLLWVLCYCRGNIVHSHTLPFFIVSNNSTLEIAFKGSSADSQQGAVCRSKRYPFLEVKH